MPRKFDPTTLDHLVIRRALHNAAGRFEVYFSEFTATWHDSKSKKNVDFTGTIDSQIALKTAKIQGSDAVYELKNVFTDAELRAFNYLINSEHTGRARFAAKRSEAENGRSPTPNPFIRSLRTGFCGKGADRCGAVFLHQRKIGLRLAIP